MSDNLTLDFSAPSIDLAADFAALRAIESQLQQPALSFENKLQLVLRALDNIQKLRQQLNKTEGSQVEVILPDGSRGALPPMK